MSCLLTAKVNGCNRVPDPPAKMIPFIDTFRLNYELAEDSVFRESSPSLSVVNCNEDQSMSKSSS